MNNIYLIKWYEEKKRTTYTKEVTAKTKELALVKAGKKVSSRVLSIYLKIQ